MIAARTRGFGIAARPLYAALAFPPPSPHSLHFTRWHAVLLSAFSPRPLRVPSSSCFSSLSSSPFPFSLPSSPSESSSSPTPSPRPGVVNPPAELTSNLSRAASIDEVFSLLSQHSALVDPTHLFTALHSTFSIASSSPTSPFLSPSAPLNSLNSLFHALSNHSQSFSSPQLTGIIGLLARLYPLLPSALSGPPPSLKPTVNPFTSRWTTPGIGGVRKERKSRAVEDEQALRLPFHHLLSLLVKRMQQSQSSITAEQLPELFTSLSRLALWHRLHPHLLDLMSSLIPSIERSLRFYHLSTLGHISSSLALFHPLACDAERIAPQLNGYRHSPPSLELRRELILAITRRVTSDSSLLGSTKELSFSQFFPTALIHMVHIMEAAILVTPHLHYSALLDKASRVVSNELIKSGDEVQVRQLVRMMRCMSTLQLDDPLLWSCLVERMVQELREGRLMGSDLIQAAFCLAWMQTKWEAAGDEFLQLMTERLNGETGRGYVKRMKEDDLVKLMWTVIVWETPASLHSAKLNLLDACARRFKRRTRGFTTEMSNVLVYQAILALPPSLLTHFTPAFLRRASSRYDFFVMLIRTGRLLPERPASKVLQGRLGPRFVYGLPLVSQLEGGEKEMVLGWNDHMCVRRFERCGSLLTMFEWMERRMKEKGMQVVRVRLDDGEEWTRENRREKRQQLLVSLQRSWQANQRRLEDQQLSQHSGGEETKSPRTSLMSD